MDWSTRGSLSFIISWNLLKFMSTELLMPSNHLILCHLLLILPSVFPRIMVFSNESIFTSGGQSTEASAAVSSLPKDVQGWFPMGLTGWSPCSPRDSQESSPTPQFKALILQCSAFFMVPLSQPYMATGKTKVLTRWTLVGKVMSLLINMLPRLVMAFLPRSKCLLVLWLQSPSAVILEPPQNSLSLFPLFPHLFTMKWWDQMPWS